MLNLDGMQRKFGCGDLRVKRVFECHFKRKSKEFLLLQTKVMKCRQLFQLLLIDLNQILNLDLVNARFSWCAFLADTIKSMD